MLALKLRAKFGGFRDLKHVHHFRTPLPTKTYLWSRIDAKLKLCLLAVVDGEALHEERGETGAGAATERVEDQESLQI